MNHPVNVITSRFTSAPRLAQFVLAPLAALLVSCVVSAGAEGSPAAVPRTQSQQVRKLERSYWLHASLGESTQKGYWGLDYRATPPPSSVEVANAARLLTKDYGASRLYLIYHAEMPVEDAVRIFGWWRKNCPKDVEIVPALVLRMYDQPGTPVFSPVELRTLCHAFKRINPERVAVYDIYPNRDQGPGLDVLYDEYPHGLLRVGLQPGETLPIRYTGAAEDTWSAFCHGKTNADWSAPGFGAETLRKWVAERNAGNRRVSWDLITVAWDYSVTQRGEYPGYDDAEKNMPLPPGRNRLALQEILGSAVPDRLLGFSSDLFILHANSASRKHDGPEGTFYGCLKRGERYRGYYAAPLDEIAALYGDLKRGALPTAG